ncbi:MAG: hypothetical protein F6K48_14235 [Okeania sp. SIO3H1]|uniref:hypothetical protein n=1 Tax=Okeania sp. SIO1I7 TaxID=2607772 RepID=UPI0013CBDD16|nr:hypothetical protein [Okeania sp. SIO1I7]NEN90004.1 hypothetical protein [Okeania sp. SIO3H1]NET29267.1 hypothetical protein [Okeania sp. SIO1I7]
MASIPFLRFEVIFFVKGNILKSIFIPHSAPQNVATEEGVRRQETEFEKKIMTAVIE